MTIQIGLKNFKAFQEIQGLTLKPLTILCGINSSGKSSVLQSQLFLKQTNELRFSNFIKSPKLFRFDYLKTKPKLLNLIYNGDFTNLDSFENIIYKKQIEEIMEFSWNLKFNILDAYPERDLFKKLPKNLQKIDTSLKIGVKKADLKKEKLKKPIADAYLHQMEFYDKINDVKFELIYDGKAEYNSILNNSFILEDLLQTIIFEFRSEENILKFFQKEYDNLKVYLKNNLKESLFDKIKNFVVEDIVIPLLIPIEIKSSEEYGKNYKIFFQSYFDLLVQFINDLTIEPYKKIIPTLQKYRKEFITPQRKITDYLEESKDKITFDIMNLISFELSYYKINSFLQTLRYIGPLRDNPKRYYFFDDISGLMLGNKGEFAPQILAIEGNQNVPTYKMINLKKENIEFKDKSKVTLEMALKDWLTFMDLPDIRPTTYSKIPRLYEISVFTSYMENSLSISDVGFGISQILPILIEVLRMDHNETIILEQPEIHLHPNLQAKLADFLIAMGLSKRNFIVETHSEHFLNRICLRIAQDKNNEILDLINMQFVSPPSKKEGAKLTKVKLNQFGEIENWPNGFLDTSDNMRIMEYSLKKRMEKKV